MLAAPHATRHQSRPLENFHVLGNAVERDGKAVRQLAHLALAAQEKAFTRAQDDLNRQRRALPWERVEKTYAFDRVKGKETLADLFAGRSQRRRGPISDNLVRAVVEFTAG